VTVPFETPIYSDEIPLNVISAHEISNRHSCGIGCAMCSVPVYYSYNKCTSAAAVCAGFPQFYMERKDLLSLQLTSVRTDAKIQAFKENTTQIHSSLA
jgi:hypothetical protein